MKYLVRLEIKATLNASQATCMLVLLMGALSRNPGKDDSSTVADMVFAGHEPDVLV